MLHRLRIALAQVKAGNSSEKVFNEMSIERKKLLKKYTTI